MEKLNKLRQGQEIDLSFLNKFVATVNEIIDKFSDIEDATNENERLTHEIDEALKDFSDNYLEKINGIPNLQDMLSTYAGLANTYSFKDEIVPIEENSPLNREKNLTFIVTNDITPYLNTTLKPVKEKTIILELKNERIEYRYTPASIESQEDFDSFEGQLYYPEDGLYAEAHEFVEGTVYFKKEHLDTPALVKANRLWFYYNKEFFNLSTDSNGHTIIQTIPTITLSGEFGHEHWVIGGIDSGVEARGPKGEPGAIGPRGQQGIPGPRGDTGVRGPQGIPGDNGKTPIIKIASCDDSQGITNFVEGQFIPGRKYIGLKFVYAEDDEATLRATPWYFVKIAGETYYPHLSNDGSKLFFSTEPPSAEEAATGYSVKGATGERGIPGPAPVLTFLSTESETPVTISPTRIVNEEDTTTAYYSYEAFRGPKGDKGDDGTSVTIKGKVASYAALVALSTSSISNGDGYIVDVDEEHDDLQGTLYIFAESVNEGESHWTYAGQVKGPKGDKGEKGDRGDDAVFTEVTAETIESPTTGVTVTYPVEGDSHKLHFAFSIPAGADGSRGSRVEYSAQPTSSWKDTLVVAPYAEHDIIISSEYDLLEATLSTGDVVRWVKRFNMIGLAGTKVSVYSANSDPTASVTNPRADDLALSSSSGELYKFSVSNGWVSIGNLKGPKGEKGDALSVLAAYPIGSIYMSVNNTDPSLLFGGTWLPLENRFLIGASTSYAVESTGGSADAIVPKHSHSVSVSGTATTDKDGRHQHYITLSAKSFRSGTYTGGDGHNYVVSGNYYEFGGDTEFNGEHQHSVSMTSTGTAQTTGESVTGANMPPYLAVFMWKRIA